MAQERRVKKVRNSLTWFSNGRRAILAPVPVPHVLWTDSMTLIWTLLLGGRMGRYTGSPWHACWWPTCWPQGFLCWQLCWPEHPASLMENTQCGDERQIGSNCLSSATARHPSDGSHPTPTALWGGSAVCVEAWEASTGPAPDPDTYVSAEGPACREHFGAKEHNYSHWLCLNHTAEWMDLARFLFMNPEAASPAERDATPLRLLSWLSFWNQQEICSLRPPCCASPP